MRRRLTQFTTAILANSYFPGFLQARIYRGGLLKAVCVPFLNCYSCPGGAWGGSCPVGSFQSLAAGGFSQTVSLYVLGVLTAVGGL